MACHHLIGEEQGTGSGLSYDAGSLGGQLIENPATDERRDVRELVTKLVPVHRLPR